MRDLCSAQTLRNVLNGALRSVHPEQLSPRNLVRLVAVLAAWKDRLLACSVADLGLQSVIFRVWFRASLHC